jgi:hypothetical protein
MSATELAPIHAAIDNPADWETLNQEIVSLTGVPSAVTPDAIAEMIGSAVPLLFEADRTGKADLVRGTFTDQLVAQCRRNPGSLSGEQPLAAGVHLVGAHVTDGHPVVRAHLTIEVRRPDGSQGVNRQFWDLQLGAQVTVGQGTCPNCGAPIGQGELICEHCHTDVRGVVEVPVVVSRLELY